MTTTQVDFFFDPLCPWAWMTSRWMLEVERVRDVHTTFKVMSLAYLNEGNAAAAAHGLADDSAWYGVRTAIAVQQAVGSEGVRAFYTALGTRFHPGGEPRTIETVRAALVDAGLDPALADQALTTDLDAAVKASHHEGMDPVGSDVGTPVIHVNGMALFGPVISPAPKGEQAGDLWDGFEKVTAYPGFFEAKRSRTVGPIFD